MTLKIMQQACIVFVCWCLFSLSFLIFVKFSFLLLLTMGSSPLLLVCFSQALVVPLESHLSKSVNPSEWEEKDLTFFCVL